MEWKKIKEISEYPIEPKIFDSFRHYIFEAKDNEIKYLIWYTFVLVEESNE